MKQRGMLIATLAVLIACRGTVMAQFCLPGVTGTKRYEYDSGTELLPIEFQTALVLLEQCGQFNVEWLGFKVTADVTAGNSTAAFNIDYSGIAAMNQAIDAMGDLGNLEPGWGASPCPQVVAEMPILEVGGNVNLYAFHFGPGGYVKWTVQATVTACDTIRVTSPEPTTLEVPIKIAGMIVAGESFGDQPTTSAHGTLRLWGFFAAGTLGPHELDIESVGIIPTSGSIAQEGFMYVNVPAGTSEFDYEIVAEFEAEAGAKGTGFFGSIAGSSTVGLVFPHTIRVGNFRGVDGAPLPDGIVIESALNGMRYNPDVDVMGDIDGDGAVTLEDYLMLATCAAGPAVTMPPLGCDSGDFDLADLDLDGDVDVQDFGLFQQAFGSGP